MDNKHPECSGEPDFIESDKEVFAQDLGLWDQRSVIFHLLYAADCFDYTVSLNSIVDNFARGYNLIIPADSEIFKRTQAIIDQRDDLDLGIKPFLSNWRFERIGVATRLILRFAFWELLNSPSDEVLVINEAIELAKCFAEKDAYKFINGILDRYIKSKESNSEFSELSNSN